MASAAAAPGVGEGSSNKRSTGRQMTGTWNPKGGQAINRRASNFSGGQPNRFQSVNGEDCSAKPLAEGTTPPQPTWLKKQCNGLMDIFIQPLNVLLIFVPLGITSGIQEWGCLCTFLTNFIAIIPLAAVLGASTESLAAHVGQMLGGLLNATFGNAVEMIVTINAIKAGLVSVVQQSLIGSILSNLLLVLGMAFLGAGLVSKESAFNAQGAGTNVSCLVLSSLALTLPTVFANIPDTTVEDGVMLSRIIALVMGSVYVAFLVFQLRTHADLFIGDDEGGEEETDLAVGTSVGLLVGTTCCVAYCSEFLVDSIEGVSETYGLPEAFIGLILLPIVGNAAEHTTAVTAAYKEMMDLALGVAVGSSTQIALFVVPFSVIVGWVYDVPMTLNFQAFDTTVFLLSVFIASGILGDGVANWFEGLMLCSTYAIVAIITWFIPEAREPGRALMMTPPAGGGFGPSVFV
jgi:Ca2+:H+ antiporter